MKKLNWKLAETAKKYGYDFIKKSVNVDEVINEFNNEGKIKCADIYGSEEGVDIVYNEIFEQTRKKFDYDDIIDVDDYFYFFEMDDWITKGMKKAYSEILHCPLKFIPDQEFGYFRKMTDEEWRKYLDEIDG